MSGIERWLPVVLLGFAACRPGALPPPQRVQLQPLGRSATASTPATTAFQAAPSTRSHPPWLCRTSLPSTDFGAARHAKDRDDVEQQIEGPHAREVYEAEMNGRPAPDRLGVTLPPFVTRQRAIEWTAHPRPETVSLVAARRLPGSAERWVVIALGKAVGAPEGYPGRTDARLAVVETSKAGSAAEPRVQRVARTRAPLSPRAGWNIVPEDFRPVGLCDDSGCEAAERPDGLDERTELAALDLAPYTSSASDGVFGVVTYRTEGYAGGGAQFETLSLFHVFRDELLPVLDVPWAVEKEIAGDWNLDGTRQHDWFEASFVLEPRPSSTTMADIVLRSSSGRDGLLFRWNAEAHAYACP